MLLFSFEQCVDPFTILLVEGSSTRALSTHLSNHVFLWWSSFFWKCPKFNLNLENVQKKKKKKKKEKDKMFRFWHNCISKYCNKLPLLKREYLSSAVNGLHYLWWSSFFWKCSKLNLNLENGKNWEYIFLFWDKCIWKCCNKLPLLRK